jgi:hypothetical protein
MQAATASSTVPAGSATGAFLAETLAGLAGTVGSAGSLPARALGFLASPSAAVDGFDDRTLRLSGCLLPAVRFRGPGDEPVRSDSHGAAVLPPDWSVLRVALPDVLFRDAPASEASAAGEGSRTGGSPKVPEVSALSDDSGPPPMTPPPGSGSSAVAFGRDRDRAKSAPSPGAGRDPAVSAPGDGGFPRAGMSLGKCLLTEEIGRGGSSVVFRGLHRALGIPVAVKVLLGGSPAESRVQTLFRREARLLARLNHPNIIRVLDFEDEGAFPYLVLEYVEGLSLGELIQQSGRLQSDRAVDLFLQVCRGLSFAAEAGVIHRDVKPQNILLARDGAAKVADLGLAQVVEGRLNGQFQSNLSTAMLVGTVAYMSPEQAAGSRLDHRSDIYSLGATLYHAVTGRVPFRGKAPTQVLLKHASEPPTPPHLVAPHVSAALSAVIVRMLAKDPADRFQTYAELTAALAGLRRSDTAASAVLPAMPGAVGSPSAAATPSAQPSARKGADEPGSSRAAGNLGVPLGGPGPASGPGPTPESGGRWRWRRLLSLFGGERAGADRAE